MLEAEQSALDRYNARRAKPPVYTLARLSPAHPSVHIAAGETPYAVCGTLLGSRARTSAEGATHLCAKCRIWLVKRIQQIEA